MSTTIDNKVKTLKTTDATTFLSWDFNNLKAKDRDVTNLKNAIVKNGWSFPVFVWYGHNYVIDGAGRRKAVEELLKEGYTIPSIPYVEIEAKDLQEAKQKVLEVSSQFGNMTKGSILEFAGDDFDQIDWASVAIGFTSDDFLTEDDKDDETPVAPEQPQTELGDIYILGNHRILCGDSTKATDFKKLMDGAKADMVFTDPPYNVDYKGSAENTKQGILNDKMDDEAFRLFLGSGSTLIVCEKSGRACYGMELDPKYVDVVVERWLQYTNQTTVIKNGEEYVWKTQA